MSITPPNNTVYNAAAKIQELAKSMSGQQQSEQAANAGGLFSDLVKRPFDKMRRSLETSEELSLAVLQGSPHANPVAAAIATQEASHQTELASEVLQRLVKLFDDMLKITL